MLSARVSRIVRAVLLLVLVPLPAFAAWPSSPFVNLPVCTASGAQERTGCVSDGASGAIITWNDFRNGTSWDIYAQHVLASGALDPAWPGNGLLVATGTGVPAYPLPVPDGAGGAIIPWADDRNGTYDVFAQHVLASGAVDPAWPANGRALCLAANNQELPLGTSDGAGGAIVTWGDHRNGTTYAVYAQHVLASGAVDPAWPANGRMLSSGSTAQALGWLAADGAGGAIVTWVDNRNGNDDVFAQRVLASGTVDPAWPPNGRTVCNAAGNQAMDDKPIVADGTGGAIVVWHDPRNPATGFDVYAQHVLASGVVDPAWPANGRGLCTLAADQQYAEIVSDGAGGGIVCWNDLRNSVTTGDDIYAHHLLASGNVDPAWPPDGRVVCAAAGNQDAVSMVSDGAGGTIVTWWDWSGGKTDLYVHHMLASGVADPAWPTNGRALSLAANDQENTFIVVTDGAGGAITSWVDHRSDTGANPDIYAQRVARFGYLGTPEAEILSVKDVPNDQGGRAKLSWNASYLDLALDPNLAAYDLYRSVPTALAAQAWVAGAVRRLEDNALPGMQPGELVSLPLSQDAYAWEYVATVNSNHFASQYSYLVPTAFDSVAGSNPKTAFLVLARNSSGSMFWPSQPDSGYSVDNLPPAAPAQFAGEYAAGATRLHWSPSLETDLAGYRLYRGTSPSFVPGPTNLVATVTVSGYTDAAGAPYVYKLTAVDRHGNESLEATFLPGGTTDVGDGAGVTPLWLALPEPNPAVSGTALRYAVPREGWVRLAIYDPAGRRILSLVDGEEPAGVRTLTWNLRDTRGRTLGAGLYFVRLEAGGRAIARRIAIMPSN